MSTSLSRGARLKVLSSVLAAVLVALVLVVYRRLRGVSFPLVKADKTTPKAVEEARKDTAGNSGEPADADQAAQVKETKKKGGPKGPVPQKIDLFTAEVTRTFPVTMAEARCCFPRKFEVHGHVVVIRMNPGVTAEQFKPLAGAFARSFSPIEVDVVLLDRDGIVGELRRPKLELLYSRPREEMAFLQDGPRLITKRWKELRAKGLATCVPIDDLQALLQQYAQSTTYTVHVENGVRYGFDVDKVMFSSGNTTERMHFAAVKAKGEVVVDMFVGIGYFTLPLAMHGGVAVIHALDKNTDSVAFVRLNAVQNRVDHVVKPQCGDNRVIGEELGGTCDRVLMGLIPTCKEFLPRARFFLKKNDVGRPVGVVHYHYLADKPVARKVALDDVTEELGEDVAKYMTITDLRCVKSYAPKRFHYVADLTFE